MKHISYSLFLVTLMMVFGQQAYSQQFEVINNQTAIKAKLNNLDVIFEGPFTKTYNIYKIKIKRILLKKGEQVLQDLKDLNLSTTTIYSNDFSGDFNHDGFQDLKLRKTGRGVKSNLFECFIFNPKTQTLKYNAFLSKQAGLIIGEKFVVCTETTLYAHGQSSSYTKYFEYDAKDGSFNLVKTERYRSDSNPNKRDKFDKIKELKNFKGKKGKN